MPYPFLFFTISIVIPAASSPILLDKITIFMYHNIDVYFIYFIRKEMESNMIHSFLLIGQSNAAGRGLLTEAEPLDTCGGRLKVMRNGSWVNMFRPVNPDRHVSGVCFAESFAKEYARAHPEAEVGIIPCADGGTQISQWLPKEILFENAVNHARLAMRTSVLKGILWHQGENDCFGENYALYANRFRFMMNELRGELGCHDLPIIIGGLGDFLAKFETYPEVARNYVKLNGILRELGENYPHCAFVSAEGLGANTDNLHFNAAALKRLGIRYYQAFTKFDDTDKDLFFHPGVSQPIS